MSRLTPAEVAAINASNALLKAARAQAKAAEAEAEVSRRTTATMVTLKGDEGEQGPIGLTGPQGLAIKGEPGANGVDGKDGDPGKPGPRGLQGTAGKDGVGPDERVRVSKKDPAAGFLADKLKPGLNVQFRQEKSPDGDSLVIDALGGSGGGGGGIVSGGTPGIDVYDDGAAVGRGDKVSFDGGSPITVSGGIVHVPVGGGSGGSDANFVHDQAIAATTWNVAHNLGKRAAVQVVDSAGTQVEGDIIWIDNNHVRLEFSAPFSGSAFFN